MEPYSQIFASASNLLGSVLKPAPTAGIQRADGYSLGGNADTKISNGNAGGATGGAYGGAWSQANIDGSNWVVTTGNASSNAAGLKSGDNGGFSPSQSVPAPQNSFEPAQAMAKKVGEASSGTFLLIALAIGAYALLK